MQVHWVQCDGCELWFHLYCIGLKPEQVSEDQDFICKTCKPNKNKVPEKICSIFREEQLTFYLFFFISEKEVRAEEGWKPKIIYLCTKIRRRCCLASSRRSFKEALKFYLRWQL